MIASVHIADVGAARALRLLARPPTAGSVTGLRHAEAAAAAPLRGPAIPRPQPGRVALLGFWENDVCLDRFLAGHPLARLLAGGWQARLDPLRAWGNWPGLPEGLPRSRTASGDGPVLVLTLARTRMSQLLRFLAASLPAERAAQEAPGFLWGTALTRPPLFATCSIWDNAEAAASYAYGRSGPAHPGAIAADRAKPFHHRSAFARFRLCTVQGGLGGANPMPGDWRVPRPGPLADAANVAERASGPVRLAVPSQAVVWNTQGAIKWHGRSVRRPCL